MSGNSYIKMIKKKMEFHICKDRNWNWWQKRLLNDENGKWSGCCL